MHIEVWCGLDQFESVPSFFFSLRPSTTTELPRWYTVKLFQSGSEGFGVVWFALIRRWFSSVWVKEQEQCTSESWSNGVLGWFPAHYQIEICLTILQITITHNSKTRIQNQHMDTITENTNIYPDRTLKLSIHNNITQLKLFSTFDIIKHNILPTPYYHLLLMDQTNSSDRLGDCHLPSTIYRYSPLECMAAWKNPTLLQNEVFRTTRILIK